MPHSQQVRWRVTAALLWCAVLLTASAVASEENQYKVRNSIEDYPVNVFIGTGGIGFGIGSNPVTPQTPYGMCRVGPDTSPVVPIWIFFNHFGGYYYPDSYINTFSHVHMVGAGVAGYGWLGVMPITLSNDASYTKELEKMLKKLYGLRSKFSHDDEVAQPGYYKVLLKTYDITAELTASDHAAVHRYKYRDAQKRRAIIFDTSYTLDPKSCRATQTTIDAANNRITGYLYSSGPMANRFGGCRIYFNVTITKGKVQEFGAFDEKGVHPGQLTSSGCDGGAYVLLDSDEAVLHYGISFVDEAQAGVNVQTETQFQSFDDVKRAAQQAWLKEFQRFDAQSPFYNDEINFYSALYHSMMSPTKWSEVNGVYRGFDYQVRTKPSYMDFVYTDLSIWDTHRTQFPFILFHDAKRMYDISQSLMLIYQQADYLAKWPFAYGWTGCMIGSHACVVLADQITKNEIDSNFNVEEVLQAMIKVSNTDQPHDSRYNPVSYVTNGFVPYEDDTKSACDTLSYAYDDWGIYNVAKYLKKDSITQEYYNRSMFFKNVYDPQSRFFCPRYSNGTFDCPQGLGYLYVFDKRYTEGNAWQYRYFVPGQPEELVKMMTIDYFIYTLNKFVYNSRYDMFTGLPNPYYWPGNEEDLFSIFMFSYANRPDLTQNYTRWVLKEVYKTTPDGIPGNDDYGTMSAWYLFASMGLYPRTGCSQYVVTSSPFNKIKVNRIQLDGKSTCPFTVNLHNNSPGNVYVSNITLNGVELKGYPFLYHDTDLSCTGGRTEVVLDYYMSSTPRTLNGQPVEIIDFGEEEYQRVIQDIQ